MITPHATTTEHEAKAWLAGRLQWEQFLGDLRARAGETGGPIVLATEPADEPAPRAA